MSLSSDEFARMIDRSNMDEVLTLTFQDDAAITLNLHDFVFVTQSRQRLEQELQARIIEQQDLFGDLIRNRRFQRCATKFIAEYRRYQPYSRPALTTSSSSADSEPPRRFANVRNSVPGSPTNPIDVDSDTPLDGCDSSSPGSPANPINVDSDIPLPPKVTVSFKPSCNNETPTPGPHHDSVLYVNAVALLCDHYDMSPVDFKRLRGDIPYDHDQ
jgi:hypothetical protein